MGRPGQPIGIRTAFGWTLTGSVSDLVPGHLRSVMLQSALVRKDDFIQDIRTIEAFGTKFDVPCRSQEDVRAENLMNDTVRERTHRYGIGLLWKQDDVNMSDNYKMAYRRLQSLERSLDREPRKAADYSETINSYINKGHARKVTPEKRKSGHPRRWFLPDHAVVNPSKPRQESFLTRNGVGRDVTEQSIDHWSRSAAESGRSPTTIPRRARRASGRRRTDVPPNSSP